MSVEILHAEGYTRADDTSRLSTGENTAELEATGMTKIRGKISQMLGIRSSHEDIHSVIETDFLDDAPPCERINGRVLYRPSKGNKTFKVSVIHLVLFRIKSHMSLVSIMIEFIPFQTVGVFVGSSMFQILMLCMYGTFILMHCACIDVFFFLSADDMTEAHSSHDVQSRHQPLLHPQPSVDADLWRAVVSVLQTKLQLWSQLPQISDLDILIPSDMVERVAKDIVRMSSVEPNGLNGMRIHIKLLRKPSQELFSLGTIQYASECHVTFELVLTLIEDKKKWFHLRDLFTPFIPGCLSSNKENVYISPGYQMEKKKLHH